MNNRAQSAIAPGTTSSPLVGDVVCIQDAHAAAYTPSINRSKGRITEINRNKAVVRFHKETVTLPISHVRHVSSRSAANEKEDKLVADLAIPNVAEGGKDSGDENDAGAAKDAKQSKPMNENGTETPQAPSAAAETRGSDDEKVDTSLKAKRHSSRMDRFREINRLTLHRKNKVPSVTFCDAASGNVVLFKGHRGLAGGMTYRVNGVERPDIHTMVYDERGPLLRFIDIKKGVNLPKENTAFVISQLRRLADECGVWHNLPKPKMDPVSIPLRTGGKIEMLYEKGGVLTVVGPKNKKLGVTRYLEFDSTQCVLRNRKGMQWKLVRESSAATINKLLHLCNETSVPHHLYPQTKKGKIWVKPRLRFALKALAVASSRKGMGLLNVDIMKQVTRWCGMYDVDSLHVFVVLWGYGSVVESRHVSISSGIQATAADVHRKLSQDKRWLAARGADTKWETQALYWLGESNAELPTFTPSRLLPNYPLVTQGYEEGSGVALHILSTKATETLKLFKEKAKDSDLPAAPAAATAAPNGGSRASRVSAKDKTGKPARPASANGAAPAGGARASSARKPGGKGDAKKPGQTDAKTGRSDSKPSKSDSKPATSDSKPSKSESKPSKSDSKTSKSDSKPATSDSKPSQSDAKPKKSDAKPSNGEPKSGKTGEKPAAGKGDPKSGAKSPSPRRSASSPGMQLATAADGKKKAPPREKAGRSPAAASPGGRSKPPQQTTSALSPSARALRNSEKKDCTVQ
ncbi:hypothetical protein DIPPA_13661 [Diplonema papillatum]|nr:hypothetical protein DIPPA_13661 [Diplonema papillatum]